jgi:phosphoribosylformimino-5-aminoimidazole carboxamide ribotide isomerase
MDIIPAIDLREGRVVRLYQGDFDRQKVYSDDPAEVARKWEMDGASRIHVVDLDGAREGKPINTDAIFSILSNVRIPIQVGGGIRTLETAKEFAQQGIDRIVFGTVAVKNPELIREACQALGSDFVAVGVDAKDGRVAVNGWEEKEKIESIDLMKFMITLGVNRFIYTDISLDGTLSGINAASVGSLMEEVGASIISSGGVGSIEDLDLLNDLGVEGVILGTSLYEGKINLSDAVRRFS